MPSTSSGTAKKSNFMNSISLAPLQGFTDHIFRTTLNEHFEGVDLYYTPFLRYENDKSIKNSRLKDILPENNKENTLIPQILCNNAADFISLSNVVAEHGYTEVNWNLGCPFPMVAKHQLGCGLLPYSELIDSILTQTYQETSLTISIKMRTGYVNHDEILKVLPILNKFPLKEIIIHPRVGKQMYKGVPNIEAFISCLHKTNHKIAYNGDIDSLETFNKLQNQFPTVNHWMIGRALIGNPFLGEAIKGIEKGESKIKRFEHFHQSLFDKYAATLSGDTHLLNKMYYFWEYFSTSFTNSKKVLKRIKKATSIAAYQIAVMQNIRDEEWE